jgi:nucleoside-diphosphate-sugar epimerase
MNGGVFNVGSGTVCTLNQIASKMNGILGTNITPDHAAARVGDIRHSYSSIELIQSHGFKLAVDFDEGLRRTIEFYKKNR